MKSVLILFIVLFIKEGRAQWGHHKATGKKGGAQMVEPLPREEEWSDPQTQADENVRPFIKGQGSEPNNKNSSRPHGVKLKNPKWGGSGCAQGTVSAALTPDNKTLSLIFDNYVVQAGSSSGQKKDTKSCVITLPLEVPSGFQFSIVKLDYRGFNSIPSKARTRYLTIYSFLDALSGKQVSPRIRRHYDFRGPLEEEYTLSSDVSSRMMWSPCGKNILFQIDSRVSAKTNGQGEDVLGTIDTLDASAGGNVQYHLMWQACH